jgi:hypothetical protein
VLSGCYTSSYQRDLDIQDSSAGLVQFTIEKNVSSRAGIRSSYNQLKLSDSQQLKSRTRKESGNTFTDVAAVRHGDNYWTSPSAVNLDLTNSHLSFEGFYAPLDKKVFRLEIGGGFNYLKSDLSVGPNSGPDTGFSATGFKIFTEGSFNINPHLNISIGVDTTYYPDRNNNGSAIEPLLSVGINWAPIDALELSLGVFSTRLNGFRSDYDVNTGYVDPNSNPNDACSFPIPIYSSDEAPSISCLKEVDYFDNHMDIEGQGIVGGITLSF